MLTALLLFVAIFTLAALLFSIAGGAAEEKKLAAARLDAILGTASLEAEDVPDLRKQQTLSSIPFLNSWLAGLDLAPKLRDLLSQARLDWTLARLLLLCAGAFFIPCILVYLRTDVFAVSFLVGAGCACIPVVYVLYKRNQRFEQFEQGLPGALDLMVSGLRSGHSLVSAMNLVARETPEPIGPEFRICFEEQNYGLELRTAMDNLAKRVPLQDVRIVVTAILIQKETGGNLAELLEKCGHVIRERFRLKREIRVKTAQGRLTGLVLALLPLALELIMFLVNPKHVTLLWTHPMGLKMVYTATVMTIVGSLIIRSIVRVRV